MQRRVEAVDEKGPCKCDFLEGSASHGNQTRTYRHIVVVDSIQRSCPSRKNRTSYRPGEQERGFPNEGNEKANLPDGGIMKATDRIGAR